MISRCFKGREYVDILTLYRYHLFYKGSIFSASLTSESIFLFPESRLLHNTLIMKPSLLTYEIGISLGVEFGARM